jgi:ABC-type multidrug transport system ATPase subunit
VKHYVPVSCKDLKLIVNFSLEIGIMKMGQFVCLGNLQHLRSRFGNGYAVQVKVAGDDVEKMKADLMSDLPGIEIQDQHNEMLYCNVPFSYSTSDEGNQTRVAFNLARVFQILNAKKEQKVIESYSVTQTTLEQIFVQLAGEDEEATADRKKNHVQSKKSVYI